MFCKCRIDIGTSCNMCEKVKLTTCIEAKSFSGTDLQIKKEQLWHKFVCSHHFHNSQELRLKFNCLFAPSGFPKFVKSYQQHMYHI